MQSAKVKIYVCETCEFKINVQENEENKKAKRNQNQEINEILTTRRLIKISFLKFKIDNIYLIKKIKH